MADASIIDIGGVQWDIKDTKARNRIEKIVVENSKIIDIILDGTFIFYAKMKYLGEDETYKYYSFWWDEQGQSYEGSLVSIAILPQNTDTDKIVNLNLNILQRQNSNLIQCTQHNIGQNNAGIVTYISNITANPNWVISGMGILKRKK